MSRRDPQALTADIILTQYGELDGTPVFRNALRHEIGETELSLIAGDVDADAASLLVTKTLAHFRTCRTTTAGRLRDAGFVIEHSPTKGNTTPRQRLSADPAQRWTCRMGRIFG